MCGENNQAHVKEQNQSDQKGHGGDKLRRIQVQSKEKIALPLDKGDHGAHQAGGDEAAHAAQRRGDGQRIAAAFALHAVIDKVGHGAVDARHGDGVQAVIDGIKDFAVLRHREAIDKVACGGDGKAQRGHVTEGALIRQTAQRGRNGGAHQAVGDGENGDEGHGKAQFLDLISAVEGRGCAGGNVPQKDDRHDAHIGAVAHEVLQAALSGGGDGLFVHGHEGKCVQHHERKDDNAAENEGKAGLAVCFQPVNHCAQNIGKDHAAEQRYNLFVGGEYAALVICDKADQPVGFGRGDEIGEDIRSAEAQKKQRRFKCAAKGQCGRKIDAGEQRLIDNMTQKNGALDAFAVSKQADGA